MGWFPSLRALGGTQGKNEANVGSPQSILTLKSGTNRLVETFPYDYGKIMASSNEKTGLLKAPFNQEELNKKITIIGCGISGLLAAQELLRAGLSVNIYERNILTTAEENWERYHYGRACSDIMNVNGEKVVCELGGMRFPEKAKATWQFFSRVLDDDQILYPFPNPGVVATTLIDHQEIYYWKTGSQENSQLPEKYRKVSKNVIEEINTIEFNNISLQEIQSYLNKPELSKDEMLAIEDYWTLAVKEYDGMSFGGWVYKNVATPYNWSCEDLASFYNIGFGTGGMGSLFSVGFLEILRIWLWDYANEYALPAGIGLGKVCNDIRLQLEEKYGKAGTGTLNIYEGYEVQALGYFKSDFGASKKITQPGILVRDPTAITHPLTPIISDYVICAIPHSQLFSMMSFDVNRIYPRNEDRVTIDVEGEKAKFYTYYDSNQYSDAVTKYIRPMKHAYSRVNSINASKTFCVFDTPPWTKLNTNWKTIDGEPVKCVLSDGWTRASYFLPNNESNYSPVAALLSYAWNMDSTRVNSIKTVYQATENSQDSPGISSESENWFNTPDYWNSETWRAYRAASAVIPNVNTNSEIINNGITTKYINEQNITKFNVTGVDWQNSIGIYGGFKLDSAGDFKTSNTASYAYLLSIEHDLDIDETSKIYKKIFFSSDSFSNYGGWVEGALMSGLNAAIGVMANINFEKLNSESFSILKGNPFADINNLVPFKKTPY